MYIPKHFAVSDHHEVLSFIRNNTFGQIISLVEGKLFSSHIPFLLSDDGGRMLGHDVARSNSQWREVEGQEVMVTLEGPHDYISPSWYQSESQVPTWNYQAAHVYGVCSVFSDVDRLKTVVDALVDKYESNFEKPWQPDYSASMLRGIVGVEVTIIDIQCKYKLSQNKTDLDRDSVIENLQKLGSPKVANAMQAVDEKQ